MSFRGRIEEGAEGACSNMLLYINCWFSLSRRKKVNPKLLSEKLKNIIGCRKLPDIMFVQVSGLYGIPYSSHPSKCSTQIYKAQQHGNALLVPMQMGTKHLEFTSAIKGSQITLMNKSFA